MDEQKLASHKLPAEWITRIFKRFEEIWGDRFLNQFKSERDFELESFRWQSGLYGATADEIKKALELCRLGFIDSPPHVIEFYHHCKGYVLPTPKPVNPISPYNKEIAQKYLSLIKDKLHGRLRSEGEATLSALNQQILDKQAKQKDKSDHWQAD